MPQPRIQMLLALTNGSIHSEQHSDSGMASAPSSLSSRLNVNDQGKNYGNISGGGITGAVVATLWMNTPPSPSSDTGSTPVAAHKSICEAAGVIKGRDEKCRTMSCLFIFLCVCTYFYHTSAHT